MFNGVFDDIPNGKLNLQYKIELLNNSQHKIAEMKANFEKKILDLKNRISRLEELESTFYENNQRHSIAVEQFEFYLTPRGTHFNTRQEEQEYNSITIDFSRHLQNLDFLELEYYACASSVATNQYGEVVTPGPVRLSPRKLI